MSRKTSRGKKKSWSSIDAGEVPAAPPAITHLASSDVFFVDRSGNVEGSAHAKRLGSKKRRAEDAAPTAAEEEASSSEKKARHGASDGNDEKRSGALDTPARRTRSRTSDASVDDADIESTPIRSNGVLTPRDVRSAKRMALQKAEEERKLAAASARVALLGKLQEERSDTPKKLAARKRESGRQKDITGSLIVATPRLDKKKATAAASTTTPSTPASSMPSTPSTSTSSSSFKMSTHAGGKFLKATPKKDATPKTKKASKKTVTTPSTKGSNVTNGNGNGMDQPGGDEKKSKKKKKKATKKDTNTNTDSSSTSSTLSTKSSNGSNDNDGDMDTKSDDKKKKKNKKKKSKKPTTTAATSPSTAVTTVATTDNTDSKRTSAPSTESTDGMDTSNDTTASSTKGSKSSTKSSGEPATGVARAGRNGRRKAARLVQRDLDREQLARDDAARAIRENAKEAARLAKLAAIAPTFELPGPKTAPRPEDAVPASVRHMEKRRERAAAQREAQRLNDLGLTAQPSVKLTDGSEIVDPWGNEFAQKKAAKEASKKINGFDSVYEKPSEFEASREERALARARAHVKAAALRVAHEGQSFNPLEDSRAEFAMRAFAIDEAERKEKQRIEMKLRGKIEPPKRIVDDDDEDVEDEAERPDDSRVVVAKKLTKAERNKQERKRIHDQAELAKKKEKVLKKEIHKIPQIIKEMQAKHVEKVKRDEEVAALKEANPLPLRLGRHEYEAPFPEVVLQEEVGVGSLREMKPSTSVVMDQFNMFQAKNMIEPRKLVKNRRRYQLKEYEKHKDGVSTAMFRAPKRT